MNTFTWADLKQVITMTIAFRDLYSGMDVCSSARGTYQATPVEAGAKDASDILLEANGSGSHRLIITEKEPGVYAVTAVSGLDTQSFMVIPGKNLIRVIINYTRENVDLLFTQCNKKNWIITKFEDAQCVQVSCVNFRSNQAAFKDEISIYHMDKTDLQLPDTLSCVHGVKSEFMKHTVNTGMLLALLPLVGENFISFVNISDTSIIINGDYGVVRFKHETMGEVQILIRRSTGDNYDITVIPENHSTISHSVECMWPWNAMTTVDEKTLTVSRVNHEALQYEVAIAGRSLFRVEVPSVMTSAFTTFEICRLP